MPNSADASPVESPAFARLDAPASHSHLSCNAGTALCQELVLLLLQVAADAHRDRKLSSNPTVHQTSPTPQNPVCPLYSITMVFKGPSSPRATSERSYLWDRPTLMLITKLATRWQFRLY